VKELIIVRHGETEWNRKEIFRGRMDVPLDEVGVRQAELLGEHLACLKISAVYSSPLRRAVDTAGMITRHHNLTAQLSENLIDIDYGRWQGLSREDVKNTHRELYTEWIEHPDKVKFPDGESLEDIRQRVLAFLNEALPKHEGRMVVVSHRVVNKVLICALLGLGNSHFWNIRQDVGAMTVFAYENNRFTLTKHNDTSHLIPLRGDAVTADF